MICDYYVVRRGYLIIQDLYSGEKDSVYRFHYGFSWQAYASYLSGIIINIVGFAGEVGRDVPIGAEYIYKVNYISGFIVSAVMYYILTRIAPVVATSATWNEVNNDLSEGQDIDSEEIHTTGKAVGFDTSVPREEFKGAKAGSASV